jgi:hypothetical protein
MIKMGAFPKSGVAVSIFPYPTVDVAVGGSEKVTATVEGNTNTTVK